ncbi:DUF542 domain-containing protein [Fusibacter sp. 3D3]|uniref:DUF542 domain-containing protein n=1 Tax=Fusibacter sp. 3D3 TaxID=1048380 RepID=UPI000853AA2B|nr:DUF542 domain-containing protein [Fusibacter sp. 3D3]GAU78355.1 nitric oxide-dependent regulator DnrN or NorA [Fusibacter sp. 3D3]
MKTFNYEQTIGDSVTHYPQLVKVYMKYHVDFCCGGHRTVKEAIETDCGRISEKINTELLNTLDQFEKEDQLMMGELSSEALINRIVTMHHAYLREELPLISELLFKLLNVHGERHPELYEIHKTFGQLKMALEAHLVKEEVKLFPKIISEDTDVKALILELEAEHDGAGEALHKLTDLTDHFTLPENACTTYALTYEKLKALVADMYMHVHVENNILFKRLTD